MKRTLFWVLFLTALLGISSMWAQNTLVVGIGQTYTTIQSAINAAVDGDQIQVQDGTYTENVKVNKNISLTSVNGAATTIIDGLNSGGGTGTINLTSGRNGVVIGTIGHGFTVKGIDGPPGVEFAAIYLTGAQTNISIEGNIIEARGDAALMGEYNAANTNIVINGNEITGKTFVGDNPGGIGFGAQYSLPNVPRQLVVFGGGAGTTNTQSFTFTNNILSGICGGMSITDNNGNPIDPTPQGNTLASLEFAGTNNIIAGNTFSGSTTRYAEALRMRGPGDYTITGNTFNGSYPVTMTAQTSNPSIGLDRIQNALPPANTFDKYVVVNSGTALAVPAIFPTIQAGVNAATAGNVVVVSAGTYIEDVIIDKPLTLQGANANIAYGAPERGAESIILPASSAQTPVRLTPTGVAPDNVTINGFEITAPNSNYAISCGDKGSSYLNIVYNYIHHIGTERGSGNVYAIAYRCSELNQTDINISHNYIDYVLNSTSSAQKSSAGIWIGQSPATGTYSNVIVEHNTIKHIESYNGSVFGTDGLNSSGINIGCGWKSTGYLNNPIFRHNVISDLTGSVVYGIALQGNTPGANIYSNTFDNITTLTTPEHAAALCVFQNAGQSTNNGTGISAHENSFTNVHYGIANLTTNVVDGTQNWWGDASGPLDDDSLNPDPEDDNPNGLGVRASGYVTYDPWWANAEMTVLGSNKYLAGHTYTFTVHAPNSEDGATAYLWGFYTKIGGGWANTTYGTGVFSNGYATVTYTVPQDYQKDFYWEVIAYQSTNSQVRCKRWNTAGPWSQFDTYMLNGQTIEMETYRFDEFEMDRETASFKMLANGVIPNTVDAATVEVIVPWSGDINDYDNSVYNNDTVFCKKGLLPTYAANLGYEVQVVASNPSSPMFQEIRITKPSVGYDVTLFGFRIPTGDDPLGYMWWTTFYIAPVQNMVMNYDPVTGICSGSFSAPLEYYQQYFIQPVAEIYVDTNLKYYYTPGSMDLILSGGMLTPIRNVTTGAYYETIQAAIDAAEANHVIEVQSGTYVEQLHVTTENLTIRGAGTDPVVIQSPDVLPLSFTTSAANKPVVFVDGVQEFTLKNVIVDGGNKGNANYRFNGVAFWNAGGTLEDVDVINIMNDPFSGAQHGVGVFAYNNTTGSFNIKLDHVDVTDFQKTGVVLTGNGGNLTVDLDNVTVTGQGLTDIIAQNGIDISSATGSVTNCSVTGVDWIWPGTGTHWTASGIILQNTADLVVSNATLTACETSIYALNNSGLEISGCELDGATEIAVLDYGGIDSVIDGNTITNSSSGIYCYLTESALINNNEIAGSEYALILEEIDSVSSEITVTGNEFSNNYIHVYNSGDEPDVNTLIPTNTYAPTYFIVDQTIYGNGTVLYVDAPLEVIQDNVQQTYSVKASYAGNLRGFDVMLIIPKADFATAPTNFVMGSAFTSPLYVVDQSTDTEWIYVVTGAFLGAGSVTGENVTLFTFDTTSTANYNNVPDGCYIQLPLGEVTLRDENNQPIECFDTLDKWILIDNIPPTPVVWEDEITALLHPCRTTPNANNSIDLMWTNPEGAKKIQIWTLSYGDAGTGYTHYPEYDDHSEPSLAAPDPLLGSPQNGWVKFAEIDPPETFPYTLTGMERGYYYITLFAVDEADNISAAPDAPFHRESISYWPGDVNEDGKVMDDDIGLLGAVWGFNSSNEAWNNVIDVGPSTDYARRSRPIPDNRINIEDLMMFAMNYYNTHYEDNHRNFPELNPVMVMMATQNNGGQIVVNLELSGNNGFLKGLNMPIAYGSGLQLVSIEQGNIWPEASLLLHTNAEGLVEISCATLGQNALEGDGNIATLVFNVVGSDTEITLQPMIARSWDNHDIAITYDYTANEDLVNVIPLESYLGSNFPNPFNPSTTIQYGLKEASSVRINVYNSRGQLVRTLINESKAAGTYRVVWDGKDSNNRSVSSGIYYFRMEAQDYVKTNKGLLIK